MRTAMTPAAVRPDDAKALDWERPISIFRCAYSFVGQSNEAMPNSVGALAWFGEDAPYSTVYMPLYSSMTKTAPVLSQGDFTRLDRKSAWWAFDYVSNLADLKFSYMIKDINAQQKIWEDKFFAQQPEVQKKALELSKKSAVDAQNYLTEYCNTNAVELTKAWWKFGDELFFKYNDGLVDGKQVGYPTEWLKAVDYGQSMIPPAK